MSGFDPLLSAPAMWFLGVDALAILAVYAAASRHAGTVSWAPLALRILASLGLIVPVWNVLGWYRELDRAREWARELPLHTGPVLETFALNSVALVSLGFLVLVSGIYLARRLPGAAATGDPG